MRKSIYTFYTPWIQLLPKPGVGLLLVLSCMLGQLGVNSLLAQTTIINENFSTASGSTPPTGWTNTQISGDGGELWRFDNPGGRTINSPISGTFGIFDSDYFSFLLPVAENILLASPAFDASSYDELTLTFDHYFLEGAGGAYSIEVYNGSSWVVVESGNTSTTNAQSQTYDILSSANGAANAQVGFRWTGNYSYYWAVDNVVVTGVDHPDTDGDGVDDHLDTDDDNDGVSDLVEMGVSCNKTTVLMGGTLGRIYEIDLSDGTNSLHTTSNLVTGSINCLAANPDAAVLYYGSGTTMYVYNPATSTHAVLQDLNGLVTGGNLESAGAAYYDRTLFVGTEDASGNIQDVYEIPLSNDGLSTTGNPISLGINTGTGGFGDFVVSNEGTDGVIYGSTTGEQFWKFDIGTSTFSMLNNGSTTYQMAYDLTGQNWAATGTALRRMDANGNVYGSTITLPETAIDLTGPYNCPQGNLTIDTDLDGIYDYRDLDCDNDGMPDLIELGGVNISGDGTVDSGTDTDGDGFADIYDNDDTDGPSISGCTLGYDCNLSGSTSKLFDTDGNGTQDNAHDLDGDGIPDYKDVDADQDGIPDLIELGAIDNTGDGRVDNLTDADGDGYPDIYDPDDDGTPGIDAEEANSPIGKTTDSNADGFADAYTDGFGNNIDQDADGLPPHQDIDSDNDGIPDLIELGGLDTDGNGKVDNSTDEDEDGLADIYDTNTSDGPGFEGTDGISLMKTSGTDTNSDGIAWGDAGISYQSNSGSIWPDWDGDKVPNHRDADSDNDGIADIVEAGGTDSNGDGVVDGSFTDTDGDGLSDIFDTDDGGTALMLTGADTGSDYLPDSYPSADDGDGDVRPNFMDVDADDDGIPDNVEAQTSAGYTVSGSTDSDGDGILDDFEGGNFLTPNNHDLDGVADFIDTDSDGDGYRDRDEAWDSYGDGDAVSDLTCSVDSDGDGLLDCYDNNSSSASDQTWSVTPPSDNGFDGTAYTASKSSSGTAPATRYPNNGGSASQPDWRDNNGCSLSPSLAYPITGHTYRYNGSTHTAAGGSTGTVRSTVFCEDAVTAGYTYYFPAIEPQNVLFSIAHNSNTTPINYVELRRDEVANRTVASGSQGHFVMGRDWFVQTIDDAALTDQVNIRFYYDPADSTAMSDSAASFATASGGTLQAPKWFKVDDQWTNGDISASDGLSNLTGYVELVPAAYGTEGGLHYVQFNGLSGFSGGGMMQEVSGALPIEILHFSAEANPTHAQLHWETSQEVNSDYFVVERSLDGRLYTALGEVKAAGQSQQSLSYEFKDIQILQEQKTLFYYRLKMVDQDGSFAYTHTIKLSWDDKPILQAYPNPVQDQLSIMYNLPEASHLEVIAANGQQIWQQALAHSESLQALQLNVSHLPQGIFYLRIKGQRGEYWSIRFVKR